MPTNCVEESSRTSWAQILDEKSAECERVQTQPWKKYLENLQLDEAADLVCVPDEEDTSIILGLAA
jgi:hypothetical protein